MFSGNTILGDGSVIMIIDPNGIAQAIGGDRRRRNWPRPSGRAASRRRDRKRPTSLLVFRAGSQQPKAVPLSLDHAAGGDRRAQDRALERPPYGAVSRPTDAAGPASATSVRVKGEGAQPLLVFSDGGRSMGLVVDEIVDIVEERLDIEVASDSAGRASARRSSRARRPRSSTSAISCRSPSRTGSARKERAASRRKAEPCCSSTTRRSSATCWRRCCRPPAIDVTAVARGAGSA